MHEFKSFQDTLTPSVHESNVNLPLCDVQHNEGMLKESNSSVGISIIINIFVLFFFSLEKLRNFLDKCFSWIFLVQHSVKHGLYGYIFMGYENV